MSPVQSIEPHIILVLTRDSNQGLPVPQSSVVTTILMLHTRLKFYTPESKVQVYKYLIPHAACVFQANSILNKQPMYGIHFF